MRINQTLHKDMMLEATADIAGINTKAGDKLRIIDVHLKGIQPVFVKNLRTDKAHWTGKAYLKKHVKLLSE